MVKRYRAEDYPDLVDLYQSHGLAAPSERHLPTIGLIAPGVAAGFLYLTDSTIGIIDNFVTHKQAEREARNAALDEIVRILLDAAKGADCSVVKCDTQIYAIKQRATAHGFDCVGSYQVFVRSI
jgi:hypothetical protein